jgi:hypothetical protein
MPAASYGTLAMNSLTTNNHTTIIMNLVNGPSGFADLLHILNPNGLTLGAGTQFQFNNNTTGVASLGYYKIIQYDTGFTGNTTAVITPPPSAGNVVYYLYSHHAPGFLEIHKGFLGDANDDGTVTFSDFVSLANSFGQSNTHWSGGDFNNDGSTTFSDFIILANNFGQSIDGSAFTATPDELAALQAFATTHTPIPEPATLTLLAPALFLLRKKRKY